MKPYPEYKESDIEWLGIIPRDWKINRLKYLSKINPVKSEIRNLPRDIRVTFLPMESINEYGGISSGDIKVLSDVYNGYTYFKDGDVVIAKITPCFENGKGTICNKLENGVGFGTTELHVIRPESKLISKFVFYLSISIPFREIGEANMYGAAGQKRVPEEYVKNFTVPYPPPNEQHTIAAFLDRETSRIDTLIAKKQRQIELLQEKRSALISHVVTQGLDPNVKMKDSGVEWLGEVPEHWEVKKLKYIVKEPLKYGANESAELEDRNMPRYVRITDIDEDGNLREETFKSIPEDIAKPYLLEPGDLLLARSGATVGKSFLYKKEWGHSAYAGYLIRARSNLRIALPEYLAYYCRSLNYWNWIGGITIQATIQNVSAEKYSEYKLSLPTIEEQKTIVNYLDHELLIIYDIIEKIKSSIEKLREYRTVLISAAVTGKIDVRDEVEVADSVEDVRITAEPGRLFVEDKSETDNTY
jgi:type I restriction enzyme, S subunit